MMKKIFGHLNKLDVGIDVCSKCNNRFSLFLSIFVRKKQFLEVKFFLNLMYARAYITFSKAGDYSTRR